MSLTPSESLAQISSAQKDEFYLNYLRGLFNDGTKKIFGPQTTIRWSKEIQLLSDMAYFGLTTLGDLQTLGEEYTQIIQVGPTMNRLPSRFSRLIMIALHTLLPYLIDKFLCHLENKLAKSEHLHNHTNLQDMVQKVRLIFNVLNRLHLSVFYLQGIYHTMSKRFAGIQYVKYNLPGMSQQPESSAFKLLGYMSLVQSLIALAMHVISIRNDLKPVISNSEAEKFGISHSSKASIIEEDKPDMKCSLCLEKRNRTTVTPCGHLFCWKCIHSWINTKPECPICRESLKPNKLVCLMNFE
uniref:peroxisome biogenesis factor 10-like n=1 Tax=Styela clava TaxID=7725 RepID=UPI00193A2888|nr:peroxisome biogenesis factor 10-like [Styela clava]